MTRRSLRARSGRAASEPAALTLARGAARAGLSRLHGLQALRCAVTLGLAVALARLAGALIETGECDGLALGVAGACLLAVAGLARAIEARSAALEAEVAVALVDAAEARLAAMPARVAADLPRGAVIAGLQRHPGALARLVVGHAAARRMMGLGPVLTAGAVAFVSWQAALALLLATPVMIVFFALVGGMIRDRAAAQEAALGRLATQFADRVRSLPTILAAHGLPRETAKLDRRLQAYADGTMGVLAVAFLNAGVLDFFASLAIAILAVFLGLGHLGLAEIPGFAHLALWQSLLILLLAPEYFLPFRRYAELYHAKAEGEAAAEALAWVFSEEAEPRPERGVVPAAGARGLVLPHAGSVADFDLPETGLVAVTGPSGAGKSTLLRVLAGVEAPLAGAFRLPDQDHPATWVSLDMPIPAGTLGVAIADGTPATPEAVTAAAESLGLNDDPHWPGGLDAPVRAGAENLSGGQRVRVAVARLLLRPGPAFCDEPTAKLDPDNAARVRRALAAAARTRLVVVATHDPMLAAMADRRIALGAPVSEKQAA
ncbi:MAG TPA: ATP-binding cassette domain-containing protein [Methylobacterium sp.]|uniref:ATP-binding cassette domain-containing protein n=1 Tax=Methylorubrum sp. B1-46 TaxID=2897334 RepID=UPI001E325BD3|nr:ATP-binding cassette domain-containing protein [Methylorubrum sp. B1-46]UGB27338.1 ATP-binding cassette domain-containing protein [Methylorubrum sp. B1-46]HEV2543796.1 ATP-binding cassette domain-containing protein [Methylobacterium sp.]